MRSTQTTTPRQVDVWVDCKSCSLSKIASLTYTNRQNGSVFQDYIVHIIMAKALGNNRNWDVTCSKFERYMCVFHFPPFVKITP